MNGPQAPVSPYRTTFTSCAASSQGRMAALQLFTPTFILFLFKEILQCPFPWSP